MKESKFKKCITKEPTNTEIFYLLTLIFAGELFIYPMVILMIPLMIGSQGVELTHGQISNLTITMAQGFTGSFEIYNRIGLSLHESFWGRLIGKLILAMPYFVVFAGVIVSLALVRSVIGYLYSKRKGAK